MNPDSKRIIDEALLLDASNRAFIAEVLLESLDLGEDFSIPSAWLNEINQRCKALDNGNAQLIDHESALQQLRASLI